MIGQQYRRDPIRKVCGESYRVTNVFQVALDGFRYISYIFEGFHCEMRSLWVVE